MCIWSSFNFQIVGRSQWWSMYLRMLGKGLPLKTTTLLVFFLWLVKSEKFVINRIVDHLEKCGLFYFQYGFRSSWSTENLLAVISDSIAGAFNRSGATRAVALDIFMAFGRFWHAGLLHKLKSCDISSTRSDISTVHSNRWPQVVFDRKFSQEYLVNAGVSPGSILGPTFFLWYIIDLPDNAFCNIAIYADDTTLYS